MNIRKHAKHEGGKLRESIWNKIKSVVITYGWKSAVINKIK